MTIRSGSKGTKDPAAANWDRVFGKPACECGHPRSGRHGGMNNAGQWVLWCPHCGREEPWSPPPRPAELDPEDGA